jgi:nitrite transporter NirC
LKRKIKWRDVAQICTASYLGNFVGVVLFAMLVLGTGLLTDPSAGSFLLSVAEKKMNASAMELFFRGILCNWLVCMAFYIPMTMKSDGAKMFAMILLVFTFFISGYEHSIANMSTFITALLIEHPDTITWGGVIHNLIPVTLGNLIGGGVMMAGVYYYLNRSVETKEQGPEQTKPRAVLPGKLPIQMKAMARLQHYHVGVPATAEEKPIYRTQRAD